MVRLSLLLATVALLGACGAAKQSQMRAPHATAAERELLDSAPPAGFDLSHVKEPVPKVEPRARYGNHSPYYVFGKRYEVLPDHRGYVARGTASWYGTKFHGRLTSNREPYDMYAYTAAHKSLPLPVYARVTNLENGRSAVVRINDRGPFVGDRLIDLSYAAAVKLGVHIKGTAPVEVRVIDPEQADARLGAQSDAIHDSSGGDTARITPLIDASTPPARAIAAPGAAAGAAPVSRPVQPEPQAATGYFQQCGAFGLLDNARMLQARLHQAGVQQVDVLLAAGAAPHRVVVGPYADRIAALAAQSDLASRGFDGCHVLSR
jgi:rare lipoprotein A